MISLLLPTTVVPSGDASFVTCKFNDETKQQARNLETYLCPATSATDQLNRKLGLALKPERVCTTAYSVLTLTDWISCRERHRLYM